MKDYTKGFSIKDKVLVKGVEQALKKSQNDNKKQTKQNNK